MLWLVTVLAVLVVTSLIAVGISAMNDRLDRVEEEQSTCKTDLASRERRIVDLDKRSRELSNIVKRANVPGRFDAAASVQQTPTLHVVK